MMGERAFGRVATRPGSQFRYAGGYLSAESDATPETEAAARQPPPAKRTYTTFRLLR